MFFKQKPENSPMEKRFCSAMLFSYVLCVICECVMQFFDATEGGGAA